MMVIKVIRFPVAYYAEEQPDGKWNLLNARFKVIGKGFFSKGEVAEAAFKRARTFVNFPPDKTDYKALDRLEYEMLGHGSGRKTR